MILLIQKMIEQNRAVGSSSVLLRSRRRCVFVTQRFCERTRRVEREAGPITCVNNGDLRNGVSADAVGARRVVLRARPFPDTKSIKSSLLKTLRT